MTGSLLRFFGGSPLWSSSSDYTVDLIEAIYQGDQAAIQRLAANPEALNSTDAQGNTPLHYVVAQRDLESIERLIKQGAPITAKNSQGETAADWF